MGWKIEFSRSAEKELACIDKPEARRTVKYLAELQRLDDPRTRGKGLTSNLSGLWRYRIGSWRILCRIEDNRLIVLVVHIGQRDSVYN